MPVSGIEVRLAFGVLKPPHGKLTMVVSSKPRPDGYTILKCARAEMGKRERTRVLEIMLAIAMFGI